MRSTENKIHLEGVVYEHKLQLKVTGEASKNPGTPFISGTIDVATSITVDEAGNVSYDNIVPVHYTYVVETFAKSGKKNGTFTLLNRIIDNNATVLGVGLEKAMKVIVDTSVAPNDFYSERNDEVVQAKHYDGGFLSSASEFTEDLEKRNTFAVDTLVTHVSVVEANPERGLSEMVRLSGFGFNYNNSALIPVDYVVRQENIMKYFANKADEITQNTPFFAQLTGNVIYSTQMVKIVTPGEFGDIVEEKPRRVNELRVTNMRPPYDYDDEKSITANEFKALLQTREVHLAEVKKNYMDYQAKKNGNAAAAPTVSVAPKASIPAGTFKF